MLRSAPAGKDQDYYTESEGNTHFAKEVQRGREEMDPGDIV